MKHLFFLMLLLGLVIACNKDDGLQFNDEISVEERVPKHVHFRVTNPNGGNAVGENVSIYTTMPTCVCVGPSCMKQPAVPFRSYTTVQSGQVKVNGKNEGFQENTQYVACVQEFFPACQLSCCIDCSNPPPYDPTSECEPEDFCVCKFIGGKCQTFNTNAKAGTILFEIKKD